jgi:hypothetical protein
VIDKEEEDDGLKEEEDEYIQEELEQVTLLDTDIVNYKKAEEDQKEARINKETSYNNSS